MGCDNSNSIYGGFQILQWFVLFYRQLQHTLAAWSRIVWVFSHMLVRDSIFSYLKRRRCYDDDDGFN